MIDLQAIARDAAERVHKNGGCVPQMAFAPILFALQDALSTTPARAEAQDEGASEDTGRQAIWKLVHAVWCLLDDAETDSAGITTPDQQRWTEVSQAMDELKALVPSSEGPTWGGYPVNYLWPKGGSK